MRKIIIILATIISFTPVLALAQGLAEEEAKGKAIWENVRDKEVSCAQLGDEDFEFLGDYFMGQMAGSSHEAMDQMMTQMMGGENTDLMHIVIGKRLSGCDASVAFPQSGQGFLPMMQMMSGIPAGGWSGMTGWGGSGMMGGFNNWGGGMSIWMVAGWIILALFWASVIIGFVALIKWLIGQIKK